MYGVNYINDIDINDKNVLIIGIPASGKSYVANLLNNDNHYLIECDDYIGYGFEQSVYEILRDIERCNKKTIVEGVQGYRLLRKGIELDNYYPDIVIQMHISEEKQRFIYSKERDAKKIKKLKAFNNSCNKILEDYFKMSIKNKPIWINILNN